MVGNAEHGKCEHPVEIADVQATRKRRLALLLSAISLVAFFLGSIVSITMCSATTRADVTHLQQREGEDRSAAAKALAAGRAEDRSIRNTISKNERENARQHGELIRSTTAIETHLKIIAENSKRRR